MFPYASLPPPPPPEPDPVPTYPLTRRDLVWIAQEANVFKIMGERQIRSVTIDFVPGRPAVVMPRFEDDEPLQTCPPHVEEVIYHLEDTMFGGEVFTALVCRSFVVVAPFLWSGWDALAKSRIVVT